MNEAALEREWDDLESRREEELMTEEQYDAEARELRQSIREAYEQECEDAVESVRDAWGM